MSRFPPLSADRYPPGPRFRRTAGSLFVFLVVSTAWGIGPPGAADPAGAQNFELLQEGGATCDVMVQRAMEFLISDKYREALSYVERAFDVPQATPECQAQCLQTRSCTYLRMGERARAIQALTQLLSQDPNPPYDGRMFPPAMNRLYRAVRDSFIESGTMDIGTVAVLDFAVLNPGKYRYKDYDYNALGKSLQISADLPTMNQP